VRPEARLPEVVGVLGSNRAEVGLTLGPVEGKTRGLTVFARLDNLVKGGAGPSDSKPESDARLRGGHDSVLAWLVP